MLFITNRVRCNRTEQVADRNRIQPTAAPVAHSVLASDQSLLLGMSILSCSTIASKERQSFHMRDCGCLWILQDCLKSASVRVSCPLDVPLRPLDILLQRSGVFSVCSACQGISIAPLLLRFKPEYPVSPRVFAETWPFRRNQCQTWSTGTCLAKALPFISRHVWPKAHRRPFCPSGSYPHYGMMWYDGSIPFSSFGPNPTYV